MVAAWIETSTPWSRAGSRPGRPGVIHGHDTAVPVRRGGDCRNILHLERIEPGASVCTSRVFGLIRFSIPAPIVGS